jgi:hypothetical protein
LIDFNDFNAIGFFLMAAVIPFCHFYGYHKGGWTGASTLSIAAGIHVLVAMLSAGGIALRPGADNLHMHLRAVRYAGGQFFEFAGPSHHLWSYAFSPFYAVLGSSIWVGYAINQWIYVFFLIQLLKFCQEMGVGRYRWVAVLAISLMPSTLLFGNFMLREPFQMLCLVIAVRYMEKYRRFGQPVSLVIVAAAMVPFGAIHSGFFLFAPIALGGAILAHLFMPPVGQRVRRVPGGALAGVALGVALLAASVLTIGSYAGEHKRLEQVVEGNIDVGRAVQATADRGARTAFAWQPPTSGVAGLVFAPVHLFQFLFAPLVPFMVRQAQDLVAAFDTGMRFLMLFGVVIHYRRSDTNTKRMILFLVGTYLVFCLMASLGTSTVGTGLRHHLKVFWITIALGLPGLLGPRTAGRRVVIGSPYRAQARSQALRMRTGQTTGYVDHNTTPQRGPAGRGWK